VNEHQRGTLGRPADEVAEPTTLRLGEAFLEA